MPLVLLDPWLVSFEDDASDLRFEALRIFFEDLSRQYPDLEPVRFFDSATFWDQLGDAESNLRQQMKRVSARRILLKWVGDLSISEDPGTEPAQIEGSPLPDDVNELWYRVLAAAFAPREPHRWRDPILLVPSARASVWPTSAEVTIAADGSRAMRVLATIEQVDEHQLLHKDLNPWLCEHDPQQRHVDGAQRELPVPPQVRGRSMDLWDGVLAQPNNGQLSGSLFFMPEAGWRPN